MGRVPVEFAPPGTDPTKEHHPVRVRSPWREALPWVAIAAAFAVLGYVLLGGKLPETGSKAQSKPTAAPQKATETPTAVPTATATAKPTVSPTESGSERDTERATTPEPPKVTVLGRGDALVLYSVGEVRCVCNRETGASWGDGEVCQQFKPEVCGG